MVYEPTVGASPHTRTETLSNKKHTPCSQCDQAAVGFGARLKGPVCRSCAANAVSAHGTTNSSATETCGESAVAWFRGEPLALAEVNAFRRDLLAAVALYQPEDGHPRPYGLGLKAALEGFYDQQIHNTQVYPALEDLVDADFLRTDPSNQRTNYYAFTDHGRSALSAYARFLLEAAGAAGATPDLQRVLTRAVGHASCTPTHEPPAHADATVRDAADDTEANR